MPLYHSPMAASPSTAGEDWFEEAEYQQQAPVHDYDIFLADLYSFYYYRGVRGTVVNTVVQQLVLGFSIVFSIVVMSCIRWHALSECTGESSCHPLAHYLDTQWMRSYSTKTVIMALYFTTMLLVWLAHLVRGTMLYLRTRSLACLYRRMDITDRTICTMQWSEVLERVCRHYSHLDAQGVVNRIMRRDNYCIAMAHQGLIDARICGFLVPFCRMTEHSLHWCVFAQMFTADYRLRECFLYDADRLRRRFRRLGMAQLLFTPFIVMFIVCNFFMRHIQEWHTQRNYFGPRVYGPYGKLRIREYNELPHLLERRIALSYKHAARYMQLFPSPVMTAVCKGVMFVSGSLVTLLLIFTVLEESVLLHVTLGGHQLLFYLTIFSTLFAASRVYTPSQDQPIRLTPEECMTKVAESTHFFPEAWKGRCHTFAVRDQFSQLYRYKLLLLADEIAGTLLCPWVLMFRYAPRAEEFLDFIREHSRSTDQQGTICVFGSFDILQQAGSVSSAHCQRDKKMCSSLLTFSQVYPSFCAASPRAVEFSMRHDPDL